MIIWGGKFEVAKSKENQGTVYPSKLDDYANNLEQIKYRRNYFDSLKKWSDAVVKYYNLFGSLAGFNSIQLGIAFTTSKTVLEAQNRLKVQERNFRRLYNRTRRNWEDYWKNLGHFAAQTLDLHRLAVSFKENNFVAKKKLNEVQARYGGLLEGEPENQLQISSAINLNRIELFKARKAYFLALQEWWGFWLRVSQRYGRAKRPLPKSFVEELARRKEAAVEDTNRAQRQEF